MATEVKMPQRGLSEESALIAEWHIKKNDEVQVGDLLFTIETDKTTFEVESEVNGLVLEVLYKEFDEVPVQEVVCIIGEKGEVVTSSVRGSDSKEIDIPESLEKREMLSIPETQSTIVKNSEINTAKLREIKISPRAKHLANKRGVDIRYANSSGPEGRLIERDIVAMLEEGPFVTSAASAEYYRNHGTGVQKGNTQGTGLGQRITTENLKEEFVETEKSIEISDKVAGKKITNYENIADNNKREDQEFNDIRLSNIRKVIAKNMQNSLDTTAQLTLNSSFDVTEILAYTKKMKAMKEQLGMNKMSVNDMILYGVSRTLESYKDVNAHFLGDKLRAFNNVHLGVAVDTDRGLMVPTIFNANKKSLNTISEEIRVLANDCRTGQITSDKLTGGTFTVSNLGSLGIESFTPILNPPQTGILGVGTIVNRVREVEGTFNFYPAVSLSLTFDHRALDGAPAARFLKDLKENLENFTLLLAK